jgi:hypothetical protein
VSSINAANTHDFNSGEDLADFFQFPKNLSPNAEPNEILVEWLRKLNPYLESIVPESKRITKPDAPYWAWYVKYTTNVTYQMCIIYAESHSMNYQSMFTSN